MFEYASVSASAYDVTSLVGKVNEQAAAGWEVVSIVPTGGDITAFLKRASADGAATDDVADDAAVPVAAAVVAEPSGWSSEPASDPVAEVVPEAVVVDAAPVEAVAAPVAVAAASATPAGWYPDPSGRYEMRYWDGDKWTEHVSRQGQTFTDPPVA
jgi:hypothetical protein